MVTGEVSEPLVTCTACSLHRMSRHHERAIQSLSLPLSPSALPRPCIRFSYPALLSILPCPPLVLSPCLSVPVAARTVVRAWTVRETYVPIRTTLASRHSCFRMTSIMSIYSVDRALPLTAYEFQLEYVLSAAN